MRDDAVLGRALPLDRGLAPQLAAGTTMSLVCSEVIQNTPFSFGRPNPGYYGPGLSHS